MTAPPRLTDRAALDAHRARAARAPALFLNEIVADEIEDRVAMVNKSFTDRAVIAPFGEVWADRWPGVEVLPDAETLALDAGSRDLIVHALCLHWANDPVGQLAQCRLALRPNGLFLGALFGGQTLHELRRALAEAESQITGGLSPRVAPMGEIRDLGALLQRAGFALPVADSQSLTVTYDNAFRLMADPRSMGETNALEGRLRRPTRRAVLIRAAEIYAENFTGADGRISATFEIVHLAGWAPHESQQLPLRPGSAKARLADALGAAEVPLPDKPD